MIETRTRPYEVLIRHLPDGTVAAHQRTLREVLEDGVVISALEGDARPLAAEEVADLVGTMLPAVLAERDALSAQVLDLQAQLAGQPSAEPAVLTADRRQVRLKLLSEPHELGTRLDAVEAWVATQTRAVQIEWETATVIRRDHPMVAVMGIFFGLDTAGLDQWFREAASIGPTLA